MSITRMAELNFADFTWVGTPGAQGSYATIPLPAAWTNRSGYVSEVKFRQTTGTITAMRIGVTNGHVIGTDTLPDNTTPDERFAFLDTAAVPPTASATGPIYSSGPALTGPGAGGFNAGTKWLYVFLTTVTGAAWSAGRATVVGQLDSDT